MKHLRKYKDPYSDKTTNMSHILQDMFDRYNISYNSNENPVSGKRWGYITTDDFRKCSIVIDGFSTRGERNEVYSELVDMKSNIENRIGEDIFISNPFDRVIIGLKDLEFYTSLVLKTRHNHL